MVENAIKEGDKLAAQPLAERLKVETSGVHSEAENSDFMSRLLAGELDAQAAIDLTGQLYFVYEALEQAVRSTAESEQVSAVYDAQLERLEALAADLEHLVGPDWREKISPVEATKNYVAELREIESNGNANAALAHHYVRYLGDLSGGQVIASMLAKHYGIGAEGTRFYDFSAIGKIKPYRDGYRRSLSELGISDADKDAVVDEAKKAFRLNRAIFHDLAGGLDDAVV
ncbi:biliverdin-producing heme oxygenase [Corynebacterium amycolatum]|uniref:biliverdin-producing heme oxygenase n=1 Tax=Corynebacterium amycolatum TaxID=43765 RepID=UPI00254B8647|nr:biliverdin-producing heme oxygenase [Corynebacterium amycolatum]MDK8819948.1 biliverdin-producing heme oxygenase [Corynebacterium amycolatum]